MLRLTTTPGTNSSEFVVALLTAVAFIVNAAADWVSTTDGVKLSIPALVYIVSRGLAKYEHRNDPPAPPTS